MYRTSGGSDDAYTRLSVVLTTAEAGGQYTGSARAVVRMVDTYRRREQWTLAYTSMCKAYARIGDAL